MNLKEFFEIMVVYQNDELLFKKSYSLYKRLQFIQIAGDMENNKIIKDESLTIEFNLKEGQKADFMIERPKNK